MIRVVSAIAIALLATALLLSRCTPITANELIRASAAGNLPHVQQLIARFDVNAGAFDAGETALIAAAANGHDDIVAFLLSNGADINLPDAGGTPLFWAAFQGHAATFELLRTRGARLNADEKAVARLISVLNDKGHYRLRAAVEQVAKEESTRRAGRRWSP